ncbi:MAG: tetratricopeptide repeat protein [Planctomycetia bacterium]|nr:tetratricopeptide repeat protein [Planctomycetia bacterium]
MSAKSRSSKKPSPASTARGPTTARAAVRAAPSAWPAWLAGAALVLLTLAAYSASIGNGFIWDDDFYVTDNLTLRSFDGLRRIWVEPGAVPQYYPLTHTSFWVEYHLWELHAPGYHAVNVALQALAAVLVWRLLVRLSVPGAWLAAAIFAVHPVEVESVAWITERKNVLSLVLALAGMLAYLRFAPPEEETPLAGRAAARPPWRWYALALALFVAALLAKTVTVSLPAVLLVMYWWKRGRIGLVDVAPLVPFFVVGAAMAGVTVWMEKSTVRAVGEDWNLSAIERMLVAGRALWFYAGKLVWPAELNFFYHRWKVDPYQWWQYVFPAAAVAVIVGPWLARRRIGRGPLAAALVFAGVLVPALGFFDVYPFRYSYVADHFQYHASIALIALAAAGGATWYARTRPPPKLAATATVAGVLVALGALTWQRTRDYKDFMTLFQDIVAKDPESWIGHNNLGVVYLNRGHVVQAIPHFEEAIRLRPDYTETYNNLALALADQGEYAEAIERLEEALRLKPDDYNAHNNVAWILVTCPESLRDPARAVAMAREAVRLAPGAGACFSTLGVALYRAGDWQGAADALKKSISLRLDEDPTDYLFLAMALSKLGETAEARRAYDQGATLSRTKLGDAETRGFLNEAAKTLGLEPPLRITR